MNETVQENASTNESKTMEQQNLTVKATKGASVELDAQMSMTTSMTETPQEVENRDASGTKEEAGAEDDCRSTTSATNNSSTDEIRAQEDSTSVVGSVSNENNQASVGHVGSVGTMSTTRSTSLMRGTFVAENSEEGAITSILEDDSPQEETIDFPELLDENPSLDDDKEEDNKEEENKRKPLVESFMARNLIEEMLDQPHVEEEPFNGKAVEDEAPIPFIGMLYLSIGVYRLARLRKIVRKHDIRISDPNNGRTKVAFVEPDIILAQHAKRGLANADNAHLQHPISSEDIARFVGLNRKFFIFPEAQAIQFNENWASISDEQAKNIPLPFIAAEALKHDADIWEFDDKLGGRDLVYGVIVNRTQKRIVIVFRGSVTKKDWKKNLNLGTQQGKKLLKVTQGIVNRTKSNRPIRIHSGFAKYLFNKGKKEKSNFQDILDDLEDIFSYKNDAEGRDYRNYSLYVTGHSLGGALAQLLSFALASRSQEAKKKIYNTPITCISYASPRVGYSRYAEVFGQLEKKNLLRHIRVTNEKDIVPVMPGMLYRQTGVNVHLRATRKTDISYNRSRLAITQLSSNYEQHMLNSYLGRLSLKNNRDILKKSVLQLYKEYAKIDLTKCS